MFDLTSHVATAFVVIGVKQSLIGVAGCDCGELPDQILDVAHARTHALSVEWRHLMTSISSQKHVSDAKPFSDHRMEPIDGDAVDLQLMW